jgi:hypothetical protein
VVPATPAPFTNPIAETFVPSNTDSAIASTSINIAHAASTSSNVAPSTPHVALGGKKQKLSGSSTTITPGATKRKQKPNTSQALISNQNNLIPSFAEKAAQLQSKSKDWTLVEARKNKKIVPVEGKGVTSILKGVPPPAKDFWDISVFRLSEAATEDKVKTFLQGHGVEVREVFVFASKVKGTKSSKVRVALVRKVRAMDENIWPSQIQDWIRKPKSARRGKDAETRSQNVESYIFASLASFSSPHYFRGSTVHLVYCFS